MSSPFGPPVDLLAATAHNSSFSRELPGLQLAVDSTSLGELKTCPRKYFLTIIMGYQPRSQSVHLTFGILLHTAREHYDQAKAKGDSHEDALAAVVQELLIATWNRELAKPWNSGDPNKNRLTLIRTAIWYLDTFGDNDPLQTVLLANGRPAVELSFTMATGDIVGSTGEKFVLCGHLDRIATLHGVPYIIDLKTTKYALDQRFFDGFSPDNQMSMYDSAGRVIFHQPIEGIIIDGVQLLVGGSRFQRGLVHRSEAMCTEWLAETSQWLGQMELYAEEGHWPANDKSCGNYGGCVFRSVCAKAPGDRQTWLDAEFTKRTWDPLLRRGDV